MNSRGQAENGLYAVSVVIPAYNEEASVPAVFGAVRSSLVGVDVCEIIFVDDGSTDATAERVRTLCAQDSSVRLIRFGRNFGQQSALLAGLEAARGAAVITLDCDLQHPQSTCRKWFKHGAMEPRSYRWYGRKPKEQDFLRRLRRADSIGSSTC